MADAADRHDAHDPVIVASLFDGDLDGADLAIAQVWVATCPSCAALHADLLALSEAMRAQATPARPRDFRLTAEDAARLRAEPAAADARLTAVKTDRPDAAVHATHDITLVASMADHSLPAAERAAGQELVSSCSDCAALHADLVALVAATRAMPTPRRPIDYRLTRGHAARLRPNPWRRLVAVIGSAHDGVTRPLAIGLTALGLVGVLVASAPTVLQSGAGLGGSAASSQSIQETGPIVNAAPAPGAVDTAGDGTAGAAPAPGAAADAAAVPTAPDRTVENLSPVYGAAIPPSAEPSAGPLADVGQGKVPSGTPPSDDGSSLEASQGDTSSGMDALLVVSAALLVVGLGLFLLRWGARRLADG